MSRTTLLYTYSCSQEVFGVIICNALDGHTFCLKVCHWTLEGCGFTGFQVFTGLRCSRFEKPVRSKKNPEKPVFTGDITTNTTPPNLEASSMAQSQEKFCGKSERKSVSKMDRLIVQKLTAQNVKRR